MNEQKMIVVDGWQLAVIEQDNEPRVRDIDLAERLEYQRPTDVRDLIRRLSRD